MTDHKSEIAAILNMLASIKAQCMTYEQCKKLTGMTNKTMDNLVEFRSQLEKKLNELEKL